tara:strand:+ start:5728 stop:6663 length:936 start_codon:yes stop_codon:yes gene_type:complete
MRILITGAAGFIGFHLSKLFLENKHKVIGIDNLCESYGVEHKIKRLKLLKKEKNFKFLKLDVGKINKLKEGKIDYIIHLAAQAGVRLSQENPELFINDNILATVKLFEFAKKNKIKNFFYASSSSVYGNSNIFPSNEKINTNKPLSIYGITKSTNEDLAYYYNFVYGINSIGFRFFTVYGPYGRPDMSIAIFFNAFLKKKNIYLFNKGNNYRDFTYVDDIVNQIYFCFKKTVNKKRFLKIFNIGGESTILVKKLVRLIQSITGKKTKILLSKKNKLDPAKSLADNKEIIKFTGYRKRTKILDGLKKVYESL